MWKVTDDESKQWTFKISSRPRRWNTSEETYILCGTPINTFTKKPFLLTDTIIGKNAIRGFKIHN